jgi:hypothetical protein
MPRSPETTIGVWHKDGSIMFIRTYSTEQSAKLIYDLYTQWGYMTKIY